MFYVDCDRERFPDPQNVPNMCNYAGFLWKCSTLEVEETAAGGEDREKAAGAAAAKLLTTALTLEPNNAHVLLNFGALMEVIGGVAF